MLRRAAHPLMLSFGVALFLALTANASFWRALEPLAPGNAGFLATTFVIQVLVLQLVLALFALPYLWKPAAVVLLLAAALCSHFMDAYGAVIDRSMIQNVAETDLREAGDLVTHGLVLHVLAFGVAARAARGPHAASLRGLAPGGGDAARARGGEHRAGRGRRSRSSTSTSR